MRALANLHSSFLDCIENTRWGAAGFRLARLGLFAMAIFVGSKVASGQFLSFGLADILFMAITALVLLCIAARWEIGIAAVIASTSFIAYYDAIPTLSLYHFIPEIPILEDLRLLVGQGIMLFLLALVLTSQEVRTVRQRLATPLTGAVLLFMIAIVIASFVGLVFNGVYLSKMVETARSYSFYLMFFVTLLCLRSRRSMRVLLATLFGMAVIVAIMMFIQFALGTERKIFLGQSIRVEQFGGYAGRILPPGVDLIWLTVPFVMAKIPIAPRRLARVLIAGLALLLGGLLLTFTRSVWMGTLCSMVIMAILGRGAVRRGVLRMFLALAIFVGVLLACLQLVSTAEDNYMTPYVRRFTSIFDPESYGEGTSAGARWMEIQAAWGSIVEHPWLGIGVGGTYRYEEDWDDYGKTHYLRPVAYIHNAYVLLLTNAGVIGLATCMAMFTTFFVRARNIYHRLDNLQDKSIVMAGMGAIASVLLASIMQPSLWYPPAVPCIGIVFGLVEAVRYFRERELRDARDAQRIETLAVRRRHGGTAPAGPGFAAARTHRMMGLRRL
jgi:O-antigen ligase